MPRLQRNHKDENEAKQSKYNTRERRHGIYKPNARRIQVRTTCCSSTRASESARARLLWAILFLVLPVTFGHTTACRSPALTLYASSTLPKRLTPLTEPSSGQYSSVLACHRIRSRSIRQFHDGTRWHASMRAIRRQGALGVVRCGTGSLPRVRTRAPPVQHILCGGYKHGLYLFQGGQRHHGRFGTPEEVKGGGGGGGKQLPERQSWRRYLGHTSR